jgi:hypothetical protein
MEKLTVTNSFKKALPKFNPGRAYSAKAPAGPEGETEI